MPELPEVEVLVRHLRPLVKNRTIRSVQVRRERVLRPTSASQLRRKLTGARILDVQRRAKFLLFTLRSTQGKSFQLVGHLGMTGRMYLQRKTVALPRHAAVVLDLGKENFVFEDTRYFGRLTLDQSGLERLGPEPLDKDFCAEDFSRGLARSHQAIKVKLLDQSVIAGIGNIYASEALHRARISPRTPASKLSAEQTANLCRAIRDVLIEAIAFGSTVPLNFPGGVKKDSLFYYGTGEEAGNSQEERLRVYDRAGRPCPECQSIVLRIVQASRSTFFCPQCQGAPAGSRRLRSRRRTR